MSASQREPMQGAAIGRRIRQWAKWKAAERQAATATQAAPVNTFFICEADQLGGAFNRPLAGQVSALRRLMDALKEAFRFAFDRHVIEVECVSCGENIRFGKDASPDVIEAELLGHECKPEAAA